MSAPSFTAKAPAKINLYLHVTGKQCDGYHTLESLVVFANFAADSITLTKSSEFSFDVTGVFGATLKSENTNENLVVRAHKMMEAAAKKMLPCRIALEKNIPMGAGLGGGSSDAATTIKLIQQAFDLNLDRIIINEILVKIGADVPVCYDGNPAFFSGIGDVLAPAPPIPPFYVLLIWPHVHSNTKSVFVHRHGDFSAPLEKPKSFDSKKSFLNFLSNTRNDLSPSSEKLYPDIIFAQKFMVEQNGCLFARMSGSGSAIFGIFQDEQACKKAEKLAKTHHDWWACSGFIE